MLTHEDLAARLAALDAKIDSRFDKLDGEVTTLRVDLEVHKVKTSRWALFLGMLGSVLVAGVGLLLKGCL